ncbi:MAG TPA: class I SAM-dependent RNA methyltransferase [Myxococcota bacterium]|nr:class I SAM-dependent RNA methyltransferase [Myxococcota bacterium]
MGDSLGDLVELRIDGLAAGGDGVGRTAEGRVVFVPFTAPGDVVRARIAELHPRYARAELEEVTAASDARVAPHCAVFGECGGCGWQHVDYAAQCEAKGRIAEDALRRVGKLAPPGPIAMHPSPAPYAYRARARVAVEDGRVGYRRRNSRALCAVRRCPVLCAPAEAQLSALADAPPARNGEWEIASGAGGARAHEVGGAGPPIELAVGGDRLRVSAGVFFQANPALHAALRDAVTRAAGGGVLALELHAGCGFFTLPLARAFERVIAVEADPAAAEDLRHNLARAGLANVEVATERVERALDGRLGAFRPDAVVLDPPRTGLPRGAAARLCALEPARIAYLSCDPATLARDLAALAGGGYALEAVEAFDLFPHTPHVEVLASLRRT